MFHLVCENSKITSFLIQSTTIMMKVSFLNESMMTRLEFANILGWGG